MYTPSDAMVFITQNQWIGCGAFQGVLSVRRFIRPLPVTGAAKLGFLFGVKALFKALQAGRALK